eukprot:jgi/Bigna1/79217/fgenesh1_pg.60_\
MEQTPDPGGGGMNRGESSRIGEKRGKKRSRPETDELRDVEKRAFERECKKALKKAKDFQIRKFHRKKKRNDAPPEKVDGDIEILKNITPASLVEAVAAIRDDEKPKLERRAGEERRHQLSFLLLNSNTIKKFVQDFNLRMKRTRRKREKRQKKRDKIEKDKEAQRKEKEKAKKAAAAGGNAESSSSSKRDKAKAEMDRSVLKGLRVGQRIRGIVDGSESFGVFVKFVHRKAVVSALCHISELIAGKFVADPAKEFPAGTWVNAHILRLDPKNNRVSVSFKGLNEEVGGENDGGGEENDGAGKKRKRTSKRRHAIQLPQQQEMEGEGPLESEFVSTLNSGSESMRRNNGRTAAAGSIEEKKRNQSKAVMSVLKKFQAIKSKKNRLGQRARQRLNEELYGGARGVKNDDGSANRGENRTKGRQEIKKNLRKKETERTESNDSNRGDGEHSRKKRQKTQSNASRKKDGGGEGMSKQKDEETPSDNLHPSWAAKRKQSQPVKFQGTRITFD